MNNNFYITGGTLPAEAGSYIVRRADTELLNGLRNGEFCYVLNTRQMGKSSLMARTAAQLRQDGCTVVLLDLTAIGQNLSVEQWYAGLLGRMALQTGQKDDLFEFWRANREIGPMQRFLETIRGVLLAPVSGEQPAVDKLIIFVDEIDAVRSLPFSADEFFAGIRECYNRRADDTAFTRLTFCLLGVATPSDLIKDTRISPFNIGRRIELKDFTLDESEPLAAGLNHANALSFVKRIFHWTNGHPYLTQRVCMAVAEMLSTGRQGDKEAGRHVETEAVHAPNTQYQTPNSLVDALVDRLFLSHSAQETDDNLTFVRSRILRSEADVTTLLDMYLRVRTGKRVRDDETNPLCGVLRLSGITTTDNGFLKTRNRIYERVFEPSWVESNLPDVEVRRQKRAYRLGVMRAAGVFGSISVIIAILLGVSVYNVNIADKAKSAANRSKTSAIKEKLNAQLARDKANYEKQNALQARHDAETAKSKAQHERDDANSARAKAIFAKNDAVKARISAAGDRDRARVAVGEKDKLLYVADMSLIQAEWQGSNLEAVLRLLDETRHNKSRGWEWDYWNLLAHPVHKTIKLPQQAVYALFSSNNSLAIETNGGYPIQIIEPSGTVSRKVPPIGWTNGFPMDFSPDGTHFWLGGETIRDDLTGKVVISDPSSDEGFATVNAAPDGVRLLTGGSFGTITCWDLHTGKQVWQQKSQNRPIIDSIQCSDKYVLAHINQMAIALFQISDGKEVHTFDLSLSQFGNYRAMAFSPDGSQLAGEGVQGGIRVLDLKSNKLGDAIGNEHDLCALRFHDEVTLAAVFRGAIRVYNTPQRMELGTLLIEPGYPFAYSISPDAVYVATPHAHTESIWDMTEPHEPRIVYAGPNDRLAKIEYAPNSQEVTVIGLDKGIYRIDNYMGHPISSLQKDGSLVKSAVYSHNGKWIATAGPTGICIWSAHTGEPLASFDTPQVGYSTIFFSNDDNSIVTISSEGNVDAWDLLQTQRASGGENITRFRKTSTLRGRLNGATYARLTPDGTGILIGGSTTAKLWRLRTGELLHTFQLQEECWTANFSFDGRRIVFPLLNNTAEVWNVSKNAREFVLKGHSNWVTSAAFSPDGRRIVTGSKDNTVRVWDSERRTCLLTLKGHIYQVLAVAFSPNGRQIASADQYGTVRFWNACPPREKPKR